MARFTLTLSAAVIVPRATYSGTPPSLLAWSARGSRVIAFVATLLPGCGSPIGPPEALAVMPPQSPACSAGPPVSGTPPLTTQRVASGLDMPLDVGVPSGDHARLFIVEQRGRIRVMRNGALLGDAYLDITSRVELGVEQGLLGLAFHPRFMENGRFFVSYADRSGDARVSEFRAVPAADQADPATERAILSVRLPPQPGTIPHYGGGLAFGNDGFLWIALGDGGLGKSAQNLGALPGKILRIDVDRGEPYAIPSDNPFATHSTRRGEIWAYGLRNPFRFSLDRATGELYVGDVGESRAEEIDVGLAGPGGDNYGWDTMEGNHCFSPPAGCSRDGLTLPVLEYSHSVGCAVIGGPVYRGCRMPGYHGTYFYGDFCKAFIRSFRLAGGAAIDQRDWTSQLGRGVDAISAFGVDSDGEMYVVDYAGEVYKIVPAS